MSPSPVLPGLLRRPRPVVNMHYSLVTGRLIPRRTGRMLLSTRASSKLRNISTCRSTSPPTVVPLSTFLRPKRRIELPCLLNSQSFLGSQQHQSPILSQVSMRAFSTTRKTELGWRRNKIDKDKTPPKRKKTWKERWFGLTVEQQKEAGFSEVMRLLRLARKDAKLFSVAIFLLFISASIVMALPKITGSILDATRKYDNLHDMRLFGFTMTEFMWVMGILLLLSTFTTFGRIIILRVLGEKLVSRLRSRIMKRTLRQDMAFFDENKVGDLISRLSSDAYVVSRSVTQNLSDGIKHTIVGASSVTMMFLLSPKLSMILLAFAPPLIFASYIYGLKIRAISRELQQSTGALTKVAEEQLNSIKTIQSFTAETKELHRYDNQIRDVFRISYKDAVTNATFFASTGIIGNITFLLTLGLGAYYVTGGAMTVGDLTAYLMYTEYFGSATFGVANFYTDLFKGAGAASRLFELLDQKPLINEVLGEKIKKSKGHIRFENVDFRYPTRPDNLIFKDLNLEIKAGSNVCIVGPSGRGKSTIASLLLRFYNAEKGRITIDGEDITKYSVHSIRQIIGFVQQEPILMPGTIRDNIKYGMPANVKVTGDMIEWAAARANCDFIRQFPDQYDTDIGPRGSLLSGGQKQKVAIARCLIKEPSVMILDEATSALDSKSENAINTTLTRLLRDHSMTTISIAHRLSTIERADVILVLGYDGKIAEHGKFVDLYNDENSALYKLLHDPKKKDSRKEEEKRTRELESKREMEQALDECESKPTVLNREQLKQKQLDDRALMSRNFEEERDMRGEFGHRLIIAQNMGNEDAVRQVLKETKEAATEDVTVSEEKGEEEEEEESENTKDEAASEEKSEDTAKEEAKENIDEVSENASDKVTFVDGPDGKKKDDLKLQLEEATEPAETEHPNKEVAESPIRLEEQRSEKPQEVKQM